MGCATRGSILGIAKFRWGKPALNSHNSLKIVSASLKVSQSHKNTKAPQKITKNSIKIFFPHIPIPQSLTHHQHQLKSETLQMHQIIHNNKPSMEPYRIASDAIHKIMISQTFTAPIQHYHIQDGTQ